MKDNSVTYNFNTSCNSLYRNSIEKSRDKGEKSKVAIKVSLVNMTHEFSTRAFSLLDAGMFIERFFDITLAGWVSILFVSFSA